MAYKAPKPSKSKTWCAIFAGISLIAEWLCQLSGNLAISEMVLGNFANSEFLRTRSAEIAIFDVSPQFSTT